MEVEDVRKWLEEEESKGHRGRGQTRRYRQQIWHLDYPWSTEPNKTSPDSNWMLLHDNSQRWPPCVYTQRRLIVASDSSIHKNNKAMRPKSTKRWDSLNKSYCWQRAAPWLCAYVRACLCACVSQNVCWTHFLSERKRESVGRRPWYFCLKHIHHTTADTKPVSPPSPCVPGQNDLSCVSVCLSLLVYLCVKERECVHECIMSDLWRRLTEKAKSGERQTGIMRLQEVFFFWYLLCFIDNKLKEWIFSPHSAILFPMFSIESIYHPGILGQGPTLLAM